MIRKIVEKVTEAFAANSDSQVDEQAREKAIRMATAVLMTEVARADYEYDETEFNLLMDLIAGHFGISPEESAELANRAGEAAEDVVSLHSFTQLLNRNLGEKEKEHVVALLWQIAYADGRLDKFEDSLVARIADLLYVSRVRVMRLKHDANPGSDDD